MAKFVLHILQPLTFTIYRKLYDFEYGFKCVLTCLIFWYYSLFLVDDSEEFFEILNITDDDGLLDIELSISIQSIKYFYGSSVMYNLINYIGQMDI